jgi:hypothetical protein
MEHKPTFLDPKIEHHVFVECRTYHPPTTFEGWIKAGLPLVIVNEKTGERKKSIGLNSN